MKLNKSIVEANNEDNYSSILTKIILQKNNSLKLAVYHMFEYVKPEIVHSNLFLEYLRILDNEFYDFLIEKRIELRKLNKKSRIYNRIRSIMKILLKALSIVIILILFVVVNITSLILIMKLMEFIVKLLNGNLDNYNLLNLDI